MGRRVSGARFPYSRAARLGTTFLRHRRRMWPSRWRDIVLRIPAAGGASDEVRRSIEPRAAARAIWRYHPLFARQPLLGRLGEAVASVRHASPAIHPLLSSVVDRKGGVVASRMRHLSRPRRRSGNNQGLLTSCRGGAGRRRTSSSPSAPQPCRWWARPRSCAASG